MTAPRAIRWWRRIGWRATVAVLVIAGLAMVGLAGVWMVPHDRVAGAGAVSHDEGSADAGMITAVATPAGTPGSASASAGVDDPATTHPFSAEPLRAIGLGDSVPAATACDCDSFVTMAATSLAAEQGRDVAVTNAAVDGAMSDDVLAQLDDPQVRDDIAQADLVVIQVGANDFDEETVYQRECVDAANSGCYDATADALSANLTAIVTTVRSLQVRPGARVVLVGYWNVFLDGDVGRAEGPTYVAGADSLTRWVNLLIQGVADREGGAYADAYAAFKGPDGTRDDTGLLDADGDHPNLDGQRILGQAVVDATR